MLELIIHDRAFQVRCIFIPGEHIFLFCMPERFQGAQKKYRFQVVGLSLPVFSVKDIETTIEIYFRPFYISE